MAYNIKHCDANQILDENLRVSDNVYSPFYKGYRGAVPIKAMQTPSPRSPSPQK